MPTTNARKHVIPAGVDQSITRETIFADFGNSIRDVVPAANITERTQLVNDLTAKGQAPSTSKPLVVYRMDAPGLHRLETTTNGTVWIPGSGSLFFPNKAQADSFGVANGGLLSVNDECRVGAATYKWTGTAWQVTDTGWVSIGALLSGWTIQSPDTCDYRVLNNVLYMRGRLDATRGAATAPIFNVALPAFARPSVDVPKLVGVTGGGGQTFVTVVTSAGNLSCFKGASSVLNLPLEGIGGIPVG